MTRPACALALCATVVCALALAPEPASARATFKINVQDSPGEGFNDPTPVAPVGGNAGTTLGAQRLRALQYAAELWGEAIDSDQVIKIDATYDPIECVGGYSTTLALGGTIYLDFLPAGSGELLYPTALADRIAGRDLHPSDADISIVFNSNLDSGACLTGVRWYYGLDGNPGVDSDMIDTALHEIAHGLGVQALFESDTGELISGVPSAFMTHVLDLDAGKHWDEMSAAERLASQQNVRRVVWSGAHASAVSSTLLAAGTPSVDSAQVPELSGFAADASYGTWSVATTVTGVLAADTTGACPPESVLGRVALLPWECAHSSWAASVQDDGAIAILVESPGDWDEPAPPLEEFAPHPVGIPVVSISTSDLGRFIDAAATGPVTVTLSTDEGVLLGADADARVMLNVTRPPTSSSISHLEPLARPSLLMEPLTGPRTLHDLDLTPAILRDLGWSPLCGNGELDQGEACDDGGANSDVTPDACRTRCELAGCGDGVLDTGEACDEGDANSDTRPDACRTSCRLARCGDGVLDADERCDEGRNNSDRLADACRTNCRPPRCGDGVLDRGEACDDGADNSAIAPDACRSSCQLARCGDGVVDRGEACDDGLRNSDRRADACRLDCQRDPVAQAPDASIDRDAGASGERDEPGAGDRTGATGTGCSCRIAARSSSLTGGTGLVSVAVLALLVIRRTRRARG